MSNPAYLPGLDLARAAEALIGCPFRLHGRDPATGLDCLGVIEAALRATGRATSLPSGYHLRTSRWQGLDDWAGRLGFSPVEGASQPGDICLFRPSAAQLHFAVAATMPEHIIEAHASLRRVILSPGPPPYPLIQRWRLTR